MEEVPAAEEIENQIEFAFRLKRIMQFDDKGMPNIGQNIALHFRTHSVSHWGEGEIKQQIEFFPASASVYCTCTVLTIKELIAKCDIATTDQAETSTRYAKYGKR